MSENGSSFKGPWWVTIVERTGSLGLVLVMMVGAFFIARDYGSDMRKTWSDIHQLNIVEAKEQATARQRVDGFLQVLTEDSTTNTQFLESLAETLNKRLDAMEKRISRLEAQGDRP